MRPDHREKKTVTKNEAYNEQLETWLRNEDVLTIPSFFEVISLSTDTEEKKRLWQSCKPLLVKLHPDTILPNDPRRAQKSEIVRMLNNINSSVKTRLPESLSAKSTPVSAVNYNLNFDPEKFPCFMGFSDTSMDEFNMKNNKPWNSPESIQKNVLLFNQLLPEALNHLRNHEHDPRDTSHHFAFDYRIATIFGLHLSYSSKTNTSSVLMPLFFSLKNVMSALFPVDRHWLIFSYHISIPLESLFYFYHLNAKRFTEALDNLNECSLNLFLNYNLRGHQSDYRVEFLTRLNSIKPLADIAITLSNNKVLPCPLAILPLLFFGVSESQQVQLYAQFFQLRISELVEPQTRFDFFELLVGFDGEMQKILLDDIDPQYFYDQFDPHGFRYKVLQQFSNNSTALTVSVSTENIKEGVDPFALVMDSYRDPVKRKKLMELMLQKLPDLLGALACSPKLNDILSKISLAQVDDHLSKKALALTCAHTFIAQNRRYSDRVASFFLGRAHAGVVNSINKLLKNKLKGIEEKYDELRSVLQSVTAHSTIADNLCACHLLEKENGAYKLSDLFPPLLEARLALTLNASSG